MSVVDIFPPVPDHDKGGLVNDDEMMALANDLLQSSSCHDLHAAFAGTFFGDVPDSPTARGTCLESGFLSSLFPVISQPPTEQLMVPGDDPKPHAATPAPRVRATELQHDTMTQPTQQFCHATTVTASPYHQADHAAGLHAMLPAPVSAHAVAAPMLPNLPGFVAILDSAGNTILVDAASAKALAGTSVTVTPAVTPASVAASLVPVPTPLEGFAASQQPSDSHTHAPASSKHYSACGVQQQPASRAESGVSVQTAPQQPRSAHDRMQALAQELNAALTEPQKKQLNELHLRAKEATDDASAAAAGQAFWDLWYRFADGAKVSELKALMTQLHGDDSADGQHQVSPSAAARPQQQQQQPPVNQAASSAAAAYHHHCQQQHSAPAAVAVATASQDSNNSSCGGGACRKRCSPPDEELEDCATAMRPPKAARPDHHQLSAAPAAVAAAWPQADALAAAAATGALPLTLLPTELADVVAAMQRYSAGQAERLERLEGAVRQLEGVAQRDAAARASVEQENVRLATEVARLRSALGTST